MTVVTSINELYKVMGNKAADKFISKELRSNYAVTKKPYGIVVESFWDYKDIDAFNNQVTEIISEMDFYDCKDPESVFDKIEDRVYMESSWVYEDEIYSMNQVISNLENSLNEIGIDSDIPFDEWREYLVLNQGVYYDDGIEERLKSCELRIDLILSTYQEWNADNTSIAKCQDVITEVLDSQSDVEVMGEKKVWFWNAFTWLLHTYGYKWHEILTTEAGTSKYSFFEELCDSNSWMSNVCLLATVTIEQFCQLVVGEGNFKVKPETEYFSLGLFDPQTGAGSNLSISPKEFILPGRMVHLVLVESLSYKPHRSAAYYTADETYGLIPNCWQTYLEPTSEINESPISLSEQEWETLWDTCKEIASSKVA